MNASETLALLNKDSQFWLREIYLEMSSICFVLRTDVPLWERIQQFRPGRTYLRDDSPVFHQLRDLDLIVVYYEPKAMQWVAELTDQGLRVVRKLIYK